MKIKGIIGPPGDVVFDDKTTVTLSNNFLYYKGIKVGEVLDYELKDRAIHITARVDDEHVKDKLTAGGIWQVSIHGKI